MTVPSQLPPAPGPLAERPRLPPPSSLFGSRYQDSPVQQQQQHRTTSSLPLDHGRFEAPRSHPAYWPQPGSSQQPMMVAPRPSEYRQPPPMVPMEAPRPAGRSPLPLPQGYPRRTSVHHGPSPVSPFPADGHRNLPHPSYYPLPSAEPSNAPVWSQDREWPLHRQHSDAMGSSSRPPAPAPPPPYYLASTTQPQVIHNKDAAKKRLRNSRSCAECQRRKTRCDVVGAFPGEPAWPTEGQPPPGAEEDMIIIRACTNCVRGGMDCQYSRRPAKRGPSKGYIKDLETRINCLEGQREQKDHAATATTTATASPRSVTPSLCTETELSSSTWSDQQQQRPNRPWEVPSRVEAETDEELYHKSDLTRRREAQPLQLAPSSFSSSSPSASSTAIEPQAPAADGESAEVADAMIALAGSPTTPAAAPSTTSLLPHLDASPATAIVGRLPSTSGVVSSQAAAAREPKTSSSSSNAIALRDAFRDSSINATFAIQPMRRDRSTLRLDDRLVKRAMKLLMEPASPAASTAVTAAADEGSRDGTPSTIVSNAIGLRPHGVRVAQLQGQAIAGIRCDKAQGSLPSAASGIAAIRLARRLATATRALEADALMLCYLDTARLGNPDNSALAAAAAKLSAIGSSAEDCTDESLRRACVLLSLDRWHAASFNTPFTLTGRLVPEQATHTRLIGSLGDLSSAPLGTTPAEVLRTALMFGTLQDLAISRGGWKNVALADLESVIHSTGADGDDDGGDSSTSHDQSSESLYTVRALRYALRGAVRLFYRLQTLPDSSRVSITTIKTVLEAVEETLLAGTSKTPPDPKTLLMRCAIGPHVYAMAANALSWMSRAIAFHAKVQRQRTAGNHTTTPSTADLPECEYLRRSVQGYARMIGPLTLFAAGAETSGVRPLYLRVAAYNHSTVSYLDAFDSVSQDDADISESSPLRDALAVLQAEVDGRASLTQDLGSMGLVLASSTNKEAWELLGQ